jgi:hypothetical protein
VPSYILEAIALRRRLVFEIKHDGFRCIARKDGKRVRLYSRPGNELTRRFPQIVEAVARLRPSGPHATASPSMMQVRAAAHGASLVSPSRQGKGCSPGCYGG